MSIKCFISDTVTPGSVKPAEGSPNTMEKKSLRVQFLCGINAFINETAQGIDSTLLRFEWTHEKIQKKSVELRQCLTSHHHRVPKNRLRDHLDRCLFYDKTEPLLSCSADNPDVRSIVIDRTLQDSILRRNDASKVKAQSIGVPRTFSEFITTFSTAERLILYKYTVDQLGHFSQPDITFKFSNDSEKESINRMTLSEVFNLQRNLKRKSFRYKTTKEARLSYKEEIGKLIASQMASLQNYLNERKAFRNIKLESVGNLSKRSHSKMDVEHESMDENGRRMDMY